MVLQIRFPFLGRVSIVSHPMDIKEIGLSSDFGRLLSEKGSPCPFTRARNKALFQLGNMAVPFSLNNELHSTFYENGTENANRTTYLSDCLEKKITKKEVKQLIKSMEKGKDETYRTMLHIVLSRILSDSDIDNVVDVIIKHIENRKRLESIACAIKEIYLSDNDLPAVEIIFLISALQTVTKSLLRMKNENKSFASVAPLPLTFRVCIRDTIINGHRFKKNSLVILWLKGASQQTQDYKFAFGTGSNFRPCRFRDFFIDIVEKLELQS